MEYNCNNQRKDNMPQIMFSYKVIYLIVFENCNEEMSGYNFYFLYNKVYIIKLLYLSTIKQKS